MSDSTRTGASRVIAVLGMHRSGTSWLAGSLEEQGVVLGNVSTSDPHNRKGNREHPELMALHDAVLSDNDGSWKKPPRTGVWRADRRAALQAFVDRMSAENVLWGFKDPRALLLFDAWVEAVPQVERVGIFRHPLAVHKSLASRNPRFDQRRSCKLWCHYNEHLLAEHERTPFPLLRFDVDPPSLDSQLAHVTLHLRLAAQPLEATFFDAALVHNSDVAEVAVPRACRKVWDALTALAITT